MNQPTETTINIESPSAPDAEEAVLGCVLINPACLESVAQYIQVEDFFVARNGWVFQAMLSLSARREEIDSLTVCEELRSTKRLSEVGGPAYMLHLTNNTPTSIHAVTYANIVARCAVRRRLLSAAADIANAAVNAELDTSDIVSTAEQSIAKATARRQVASIVGARSLASDLFDEVEYRYNHQAEPVGMSTGYASLDEILGGGPQRGELIVVAARPGMGKTALALCISLNAAKRGAPVGFFTLEMEPLRLMRRAAAIEAGINSKLLRSGNLDERQWARFTEASTNLANLPLFFDGNAHSNIRDITFQARRMHREHGLQMLAVDYLQLMLHGKPEHATIEVGQITRDLKILAQELSIPIYLLSQLNRAVEGRQDKHPTLSDLRQSGAIEQDADTVLFIYRGVKYDRYAPQNDAEIIVAKQRDGATGLVKIGYIEAVTKFYEFEKAS